MPHNIPLVRRLPDQVDPYEIQALASDIRVGVDELSFSFIDAGTPEAYLQALRAYPPGWVSRVMLSEKSDVALVARAVAEGFAHYIFMRDPDIRHYLKHNSRRLYRLQPNGEFVLVAELNAAQ